MPDAALPHREISMREAHHEEEKLKGAPTSALRQLTWSSVVVLAGCITLGPPPPPPPPGWCASVSELFTKAGVTCLELAGSYSLTFFGPPSRPKRYSLAPCADGAAQPSRAVETIGDYDTSYFYQTKFDGSAGLNLKSLTGLKWAPDLAARTNGNVAASVHVTLRNARWVAISDVGSWLRGRINSTRFEVSKQEVYDNCRATQSNLCDQFNEFAEEVLEATPVISVTSDRDLNFSLSVGVDAAGAQFTIVNKGGGKTEIAWGEPLTIGARVSPSRQVIAPCL